MGARRVLLTHFSQRYQKIPNLEGMGRLEVDLEDADATADEGDGTGADVPMLDADADTGGKQSLQPILDPSSGPNSQNRDTDPTTTRIRKITPPLPGTDMKVGVAFDYMRVKVGDIAHLEKFTPALLRLLEQQPAEGRDDKGAVESGGDNGKAKVIVNGNGGEVGKGGKGGKKAKEKKKA